MELSAIRFHNQFSRFKAAVEAEDGRPFTSFRRGLADDWEGYKELVYRDARAALAWRKWHRTRIGSGEILSAVIASIELRGNNLVQWRGKQGPASRTHRRLLDCRNDRAQRKRCEQLPFDLYKTDRDAGEVFSELTVAGLSGSGPDEHQIGIGALGATGVPIDASELLVASARRRR